MKDNVRSRFITVNDLNRSVTAHMLEDLLPFLNCLKDKKMERILDIGCGARALPEKHLIV